MSTAHPWEELQVDQLNISANMAAVLANNGLLNVGLLVQWMGQGGRVSQLAGLTDKADDFIANAFGVVADSFTDFPWNRETRQIDDGTVAAAPPVQPPAQQPVQPPPVAATAAQQPPAQQQPPGPQLATETTTAADETWRQLPLSSDATFLIDEGVCDLLMALQIDHPGKLYDLLQTEVGETALVAVLGRQAVDMVKGCFSGLWEAHPTWKPVAILNHPTTPTTEHAKKLLRQRAEVCEVAQRVHEAEHALERAKSTLKDVEAERSAAVSRLWDLEHKDPGQSELFDKHEKETAAATESAPPAPQTTTAEGVPPVVTEYTDDNWHQAPISVLKLTKAQVANFAASGVQEMGAFENLRAGNIRGEMNKAGLHGVKRISQKLDEIEAKALAWLQVNAPAYFVERPPAVAADQPAQPPSNEATATSPPASGTVPAPTQQAPPQPPPVPQQQAPPQPPPAPPAATGKATRVQLVADIPGANNENDGMYAGAECGVQSWVVDNPVVAAPTSGKPILLQQGDYDVLETGAA